MKVIDSNRRSELFRNIMREKGIKKTELANKLGVKKQNLDQSLLSDKVDTINRICEILQVQTTEILFEPQADKQANKPRIGGCVTVAGEEFYPNSPQDIVEILGYTLKEKQ